MLKKSWKQLTLNLRSFFSVTRSPKNVKIVLYFMFSSILFIATYMLSIPYFAKGYHYKEGDIVKKNINVFRDIYYHKKKEFKQQREEAYQKQRFVFDRDYSIFRRIIKKIDTELSILANIGSQQRTVAFAKKNLPFLRRVKSITNNDIKQALDDKHLSKIVEWGIKYTTLIFDRYGILNTPFLERANLIKVGAEVHTINHNTKDQESLIWSSNHFILAKDIFKYRNYTKLKQLSTNPTLKKYKLKKITKKIVIHRILQQIYHQPYIKYNPFFTQKLKLSAQNKIKPKQYLLKRGLLIARAGDPIDHNTYKKIKILNNTYQKTNLNHIVGIFLMQVSIALAIAFYISRFSNLKLKELSSSVIFFSLTMVFILYSFSISRISFLQNSSWYLALFIPSGFFGIVSTILLGTQITFGINIYLAFFIYFISGYQMESFIMSFVNGVAGIYTAIYMEKRTQVLQGVLIITLTLSIIILSTHLTKQINDINLVDKLFIAFINGVLCVSLSSSCLPFYESIFNLPTKFYLLELADNNKPLLRKIAIEAPSTYTHTLMVATLSERAVGEIGGDTLLTRVGCLYHDIGKTIKPTFFAENRHLDEKSKHFKKLGAYESAQVIISHVVDGIRLAMENQLPNKVIAFIPEHHGTTTIQYFYHQALTKASISKKQNVIKNDFQYPGPKPQSRETAVVMIADSVEAAARSMKNPNQKNLEAMVDKIIQNKIMEDQFDESGLMLNDFKIIKKVFVNILLNAFHLRPKYPNMKTITYLENIQKKRDKSQS